MFLAVDVKETVKGELGRSFACSGYGQECIMRIALKNPTEARRNADTFALFATAAYYGIENWETDPNDL
ncbi:uncharacterized protein BDZ99DRAFT_462306, partial [Mytilinidion resinicola]